MAQNLQFFSKYELRHDKTNKVACAASEGSDQTGQSTQSDLSLRCAAYGVFA